MDAETGSIVTIPFKIENLKGAGVVAYQFDVEYDPAVLEPVDNAAEIVGTVGEGLSVVSNSPEPGVLKVAVYGAYPVVGDGVFANLKFRTIGSKGSTSPLTVRGFQFNDNTAESASKDGMITVSAASGTKLDGRLLTALGEGVGGASVSLTSSNGTVIRARSSSFGYFEFGGLTLGETYTIEVTSKRYRFAQQSVSTIESATSVALIAVN
jgi:hypothetical protein